MKKALVIGSGLAGSSAAWKLASEGWRVQIHEADLQVGGTSAPLNLMAYCMNKMVFMFSIQILNKPINS